MILPNPKDAIHKAWMYRLLTAIADNTLLVKSLRFKGGTCAAMRGILPRFSIDLDFDLIDTSQMELVRQHLEKLFKKLGLKIDDSSKVTPQYFLKYKSEPNQRNTVKLDVTFPAPNSNEYEPVRFIDIDRIIYAQTIPTMFANKLVSITDRYKKYGSIAGRDIFDVHTFFMKGYSYKKEIIEERTGKKTDVFFGELIDFIENKITRKIIDQDLNTLLPFNDFQKIRKILKNEVLMFLRPYSKK